MIEKKHLQNLLPYKIESRNSSNKEDSHDFIYHTSDGKIGELMYLFTFRKAHSLAANISAVRSSLYANFATTAKSRDVIWKCDAILQIIDFFKQSKFAQMCFLIEATNMLYDQIADDIYEILEYNELDPFLNYPRKLITTNLMPKEIEILKVIIENREITSRIDETFGLIIDQDINWKSHVNLLSSQSTSWNNDDSSIDDSNFEDSEWDLGLHNLEPFEIEVDTSRQILASTYNPELDYFEDSILDDSLDDSNF